MVSLKSFKLISERERDEPVDGRASKYQPSTFYNSPAAAASTTTTPTSSSIIETPNQQTQAGFLENASHNQMMMMMINDQSDARDEEGVLRETNNTSSSISIDSKNEDNHYGEERPTGSDQRMTVVNNSNGKRNKNTSRMSINTDDNRYGKVNNNNNKSIVSVGQANNNNNNNNNANKISPSSSSISIVVVQHNELVSSSSPTTSTSGISGVICSEETQQNDEAYTTQDDDLSSNLTGNNNISSSSSQPLNAIAVPIIQGESTSIKQHKNTTDKNYYNLNNNNSDDIIPPNIIEHGMHMYVDSNNKQQQQQQFLQTNFKDTKLRHFKNNLKSASPSPSPPSGGGAAGESKFSRLNVPGEHFEIVWSNLSYRIEPKWYKKINFIDKIFSQFMPGQTIDSHSSATSTTSSSAGMQDNQHQMHHHHHHNHHHSKVNADSHMDHNLIKNQKTSLDPIEIFTDLNGTIKSGQMTAVLGPSGAGKTTLLNCLTGKLRKGVSGHINLIGANGKHLKMCTIPQKDHLLELLTVEENLWFASKIKNPEYGFDHVKNIERVVDLLGLKRCRSAKIGKISGGQHKRVSIAQELLSNPDILVLDEPTSGLDSLTCYKTISMLRDLVELSASNDFMKPMAIIVTIHQPQPKVFNLFHHVYILANGGRVIYEGAPELSLETITSVTGIQPLEGVIKQTTTTTIQPINHQNQQQQQLEQQQQEEEQQQQEQQTTSCFGGNVDPASFLIEIASEEYGIEPIKTLNDYQRKIFYETNGSPTPTIASKHNGYKSFIYQHSNAMDNHGYSPDYETTIDNQTNFKSTPVKGGGASLSAVFIPSSTNHHQHNNTIESNLQQAPLDGAISVDNNDDTNSNSNTFVTTITSSGKKITQKVKRRKKSTYSLESSLSNETNISDRSNSTKATSGSQQQQQQQHYTVNNKLRNINNTKVDNSDSGSLYMSEQLLYTREANHSGRFWSHTATLTHRTLLTIRRDPLLMTSRVLFHLMIPILMGHVYGKATGAANACPHYEPEIDITQIPSLVEGKRIEYMLEELHMSIENVSMFFIIMYAFAAAVLALNALSFPLNMQVLLKETRNGWYSMSSYVLAKTLADLPLELTMPCLTMALVYPLTGQPSSYLQWRMVTICLIMTLCSLIAQTQALILGALVMNSVQTAVFVSQASQLPWVILAGFTIRIKRLSEPLKLISLTSFYRLGCEAITLARYGFGICPCDPKEISGEPVRLVGIPDQLRTLAQYWIDSMEANKAAANNNNNDTNGVPNDEDLLTTTMSSALTITTSSSTTTTTLAPTALASKTDIFQHLANQLSYANSYGVNITSCDDVAPDRIRAINLGDNWLVARIWHLFIMLIIMKFLLYYAVKFSIGIRL